MKQIDIDEKRIERNVYHEATARLAKRMAIFRRGSFSAAVLVWILTMVIYLINLKNNNLEHARDTMFSWGVFASTFIMAVMVATTVFATRFSKIMRRESVTSEIARAEQSNIISSISINFNAVYYADLETGDLQFLQIGDRIGMIFPKENKEHNSLETCAKIYSEKYVLPEYREEFLKEVCTETIKSKIASRTYYTYRYMGDKNGKPAYYEMKTARVNNSATKVVIGFADVDEEVREEQERVSIVKDSLDQVSLANSVKNKFLSNVSHELLTPLNEALGLATLMSVGGTDDGSVPEDAARIAASTRVVINLINDLLYSSAIHNGEMMLHEERTSLSETLDGAVRKVNENALFKKVRINRFYSVSHDMVIIDEDKIRGIFERLLRLSIKYSPSDSVVDFEVKEANEHDGKVMFEFRVVDYGEGFPEDRLKQALSPQHDSHEMDFSPSGMNVSIIRSLVELMEGTMTINSSKGRGTEIVIKLFVKIR